MMTEQEIAAARARLDALKIPGVCITRVSVDGEGRLRVECDSRLPTDALEELLRVNLQATCTNGRFVSLADMTGEPNP